MTFGLYFTKHNYGEVLLIIKILNIEILSNIKEDNI